MDLDLLWKATGLVSEPWLAEIRYNAWHKTADYTLDEASSVVTPAGIIAMKLGRSISNDRKAHQDKGDIVNILITHGYQDLSKYALTEAMHEEYEKLFEEAKNARRD